MNKILIIGGVAGGMSAAARLRRLDEKAGIMVFEKGDYISYANCGLPYYIGGVINDRDKLFVQTPSALQKRFNIDVKTRHEVLAIDRKKKTVRVKDINGNTEYDESYDKLVLSPGAEPFRPDIPGVDSPLVYTLRNVSDTDRIKDAAARNNPRRVIIVGGGYIGLEMAENFRTRGISVVLVEMADQILVPFDYEMAALVHQHLRAKGIEFYLKDAAQSFREENKKITAHLKSGREISADMVILSIGVKPDIHLAKAAGLEIGKSGGIKVNEYLQTSDPDIYAAGDAVEVYHPVLKKNVLLPLAGPANKQGRIAADNIINGNKIAYKGSIGTAIAKIFDLAAAVTGASEKALKQAGIPCLSTIVHPLSHAGYYPGALTLSLKVVFSPDSGKILGAQAVGYEGVDKRIDTIAALIQKDGTVKDLLEFEHAYAPPYSSAKDPLNMAGFTAENILNGKIKPSYWNEIGFLDKKENVLLDVRTKEEFNLGTVPGSVNIPVDGLRGRLSEIPHDKNIAVFCRVGFRGYIAARILMQNGFKNVTNLSGGYLTYSTAAERQDNPIPAGASEEELEAGTAKTSVNLEVRAKSMTIDVDATGMQCPGPILKLKSEMDKIHEGDRLSVRATDPGFTNDVHSWARVTGNKVLELNTEKGIINALIEKGKAGLKNDIPSSGNDKTLILFDGDLDKAIAGFIIANGALAMGRKVTMFFTFWGLNILRKHKKVSGLRKNIIEKMFGWMLPRGTRKLSLSRMNMGGMGPVMIRGLMKTKKIDSLESMMETAVKNGGRLIACQMSMDLMGIKKEELIEGVEIGGVATYLEASEKADNNLFI